MKIKTTACACITMFAFLSVSHAETLGYWRMGDDTSFTHDSSGNGNHITGTSVDQIALPGAGNGSSFFDPIPQTGEANTQVAGHSDGSNRGDRSIIGDFLDSSSDFTVESLFNMEAVNIRPQYIISQSEGSQQSWGLGIDASNELFLLLSDNGTLSNVVNLGLTVAAGTDYYVGVGFNNSSNTNDISFYHQDLTNDGMLQSSLVSSGFTTLHNSSVNVEIGAIDNDGDNFGGIIDEVRISSGVLSQSELYAMPEPSTAAYLVTTMGLLCLTRRRR